MLPQASYHYYDVSLFPRSAQRQRIPAGTSLAPIPIAQIAASAVRLSRDCG